MTVTTKLRAISALGVTAIALSLVSVAPADARPSSARPDWTLTPRTHFTMAPDGSSGLSVGGAGIPNIDSVKATVRAYYGASSAGIADKVSSPYITEMTRIEARQWRYLHHAKRVARKHGTRPAIVFDADDTTLWTYDMEDGDMHFYFTPAAQEPWVFEQRFPAVPGMVDFVNRAAAEGFAIFGITGRRAVQEPATLGNLTKVGYTPFDADNFFTKWDGPDANKPSYVTCAAACTTVDYKANTRKHIEQDLGYDIVLNVGDQWSDLQGGYADRTLKLPNPTYYLPSANLPGVSEPWLAPRTHFKMKPDGSSGLTQGGEGIPNVDSVKATIRAYYGAGSDGISNKTSSPYISEMGAITARWQRGLVNQCRHETRRGGSPAVVLDADDTTLWTYDMEDGAMHFIFDPVVQDTEWVQPQRFPATPAMVPFVNALSDAGCTLVGLTGRRDPQRAATIGNLAKVGYTGFTDTYYFTKWASGTTPDPVVFPEGTPCFGNTACSTIDYKSSVRRYVESTGLHIIANFGDQYSDLIGGYADRAIKLPNPTYYLP